MPHHVLAIDQGTTSSRAMLFRQDLTIAATAQREITQHYPRPGWVEHDAEEIWRTTIATCREALSKAGIAASELAGIGITNQRETTVIWERATGRPIHNAIVWQDRRTADRCADLERAGHGEMVAARTGLRLDPYFSATKIAWLLDHVPDARRRADKGELAFGTIDSYLLYRLTNGARHATDATNASRTALFDIHKQVWDHELCNLFGVPMGLLSEVLDCTAEFGTVATEHLGAPVPVRGIAGDQQAALCGQACFTPGMMKSTYGTGCFAILNTGATPVVSKTKMLTTIGYRLGGLTSYGLEGSIFVAGAAVQWLRDGLGIIGSAAETGAMAEASDPDQPVVLVPAFVGLGAPHWDAEARGAIFGLTRNTGRNELARAALESVAFQTLDLVEAMRRDWPGATDTVLRVDGGMVASNWTMQRLADILSAPVDRPVELETTALGAAYLAGLQAGLYPTPSKFEALWRRERRFSPSMTDALRQAKIEHWHSAVGRTLTSREGGRSGT